MKPVNLMNTPAVISPSSDSRTLVLAAGEKSARMSKKDFFATLPDTMKRAAREDAFAVYAGQFSAQEAASVSGALAAGLIRLRGVKLNASGKAGSISYEVVQDKAPRASVTEKLRNENAELKARLERMEAAQLKRDVEAACAAADVVIKDAALAAV